MSELAPWIASGVVVIGMFATFIGTAIKMTWWLGAKLDDITTGTATALDAHEHKDEERQRVIIERITRVETLLETSGNYPHLRYRP